MDLSDHKTATYCEIMQQPDVSIVKIHYKTKIYRYNIY